MTEPKPTYDAGGVEPEEVQDAMARLGKGYGYGPRGFQSPNYTQTPNDLFAMLPDMRETELRATLVMIRQTFGFHRDGFKMGLTKLAGAAGLSRQGALDGAQAAEKRGTFKRSNPDAQGEAEWELVVPIQPVEAPLHAVEAPLHAVEGTPLSSRGQSGVKESIKKESKKRTTRSTGKPDFVNMTMGEAMKLPELRIYRDTTGRTPGDGQYETIWETIRTMNGKGNPEYLRPFWLAWNARGFRSNNLAWLTDWAVSGKIPENGNGHQSQERVEEYRTL